MDILAGFASESAARNRSQSEMERRRGGPALPFDITIFWWWIRKHPRLNQYAIFFEDTVEDKTGLDASERSSLKPETTARAEGWYDELTATTVGRGA